MQVAEPADDWIDHGDALAVKVVALGNTITFRALTAVVVEVRFQQRVAFVDTAQTILKIPLQRLPAFGSI